MQELEMSSEYTPVISEYKVCKYLVCNSYAILFQVCKVLDINSDTRFVTVQLSTTSFKTERAKGMQLIIPIMQIKIIITYSCYLEVYKI